MIKNRKHKKKTYRENGGITVISLVITIIVLLILAGVTIALLGSNNGILERAKSARNKHDVATVQEDLELLKSTVKLDGKALNLDNYLGVLNGGKSQYEVTDVEKLSDSTAEVIMEGQHKFLVEDRGGGNLAMTYIGEAGGLQISSASAEYTYPVSGTFEVTSNESRGTLSVSTSNPNIATAEISGTTVTVHPGQLAGEATITVTSSANNGYAEERVRHTARVTNGQISLEATAYQGEYDGQTHDAVTNITVNPSDALLEYSLNGGEFDTQIPKVKDVLNDGYTVIIKASKQGYITKTLTKTVTINSREAANFTVELSSTTYTYDGTAKEPAVTVKDGSAILTNNADYTYAYSNNTNAGTATVTVTGKGNYTGTKEATFTIAPASITINATAYTGTYDGSSHPAVSDVSTSPSGTTITYSLNGGAETSTIPTVTGASTYTIAIIARKTNYTTKTETKTVTVGQKGAANFTVELSSTTYTYDGTAKQPTVTVKDGTKTLTNNTDYTVAYSNNTNAGTATVTVTGKGNYTGTKTANFTIAPASITINATPYTGIYDGSSHPAVSNVSTIPSGTTIRYSLNGGTATSTIPTVTAAGTYTIAITASKTNYTTKTVTKTVTVKRVYTPTLYIANENMQFRDAAGEFTGSNEQVKFQIEENEQITSITNLLEHISNGEARYNVMVGEWYWLDPYTQTIKEEYPYIYDGDDIIVLIRKDIWDSISYEEPAD